MSAGKPISKAAQQHMVEGQRRRRLAERGANTPKKEGFYWAQWRIADEGTPEGDEQTPSTVWEVVHVFENCNDCDDPEYLLVEVPGQSKSQSIENFFWGPGPLDLARAYYTPTTELQFRYAIRTALGWNDKTSLDILERGVRDLRKSHGDLLAVLKRYMAAYPAFRMKPIGAPGSEKRVEQENLMALEDTARAAIAQATGDTE